MLAKLRRFSQTQWVIVAMILGVAVGFFFPDSKTAGFHASDLQVLSNIFLRLIKMLIAPLIVSTLVVGIAGHGDDLRRVGRLAWRSILYFELATTLALIVGLVVANGIKPGVGVDLHGADVAAAAELAQNKVTLVGMLEHVVPTSFIDAAARDDALQITFFTILFAIGLAQISRPVRRVMLSFCESVAESMFKVTAMVMNFAPVGIGAAIAVTVGKNGLGILGHLGVLVLSLYASLVAFALLVLLPIAVLCGVPIRRFVDAVKEPWLIAFSTASSEAALPLAMKNLEKLGVPRSIISFARWGGLSPESRSAPAGATGSSCSTTAGTIASRSGAVAPRADSACPARAIASGWWGTSCAVSRGSAPPKLRATAASICAAPGGSTGIVTLAAVSRGGGAPGG